ncbi:MAG: ribonuclease PH [Candidatus Omnitrophica bacterium]|nr:ribonuclease PH [Candidatus Omnitrophota bacterium]MBU4478884.1 ribonuclease PH [Candidatus Omnitrophota bacterium]MCG2702962.1 ribonuclease PH [Candidatus Omnitrophota bacterium]
MIRQGKRRPQAMRKVTITPDVMKYAEGSCLIEVGNTRVVCTASCEEKVPLFLRGKGSGWVTAEYGMLPRSCRTRIMREASAGKVSGRTQEIQRLIGRSLRAVVDMERLGERTIWIDCDVLQADGGTRTASITGSFVALAQAVHNLQKAGKIETFPVRKLVAAVSVGMVQGIPMLDLDYEEDSGAEVDMNVVMTSGGEFVELQGTAEKHPFTQKQLQALTSLAKKGIVQLIKLQKKVLKDIIVLS